MTDESLIERDAILYAAKIDTGVGRKARAQTLFALNLVAAVGSSLAEFLAVFLPGVHPAGSAPFEPGCVLAVSPKSMSASDYSGSISPTRTATHVCLIL